MKTANKTHGRFFALLKQTPGYVSKYREQMKIALVEHFSDGKTSSLTEMYEKYPDAYERMIYNMKKERLVSPQSKRVYDPEADIWRKRVIAAICKWVDRNGIKTNDKVSYAISLACRAANCSSFNRIPQVRLAEIYNAFIKKNSTAVECNVQQEIELLLDLEKAVQEIKDSLKQI
ncbi:MAG: hypothetical protein CVU12_01940 [Bacteroidetes bacterium HGW-Bacteroidetes-7]|jgi:hypothetical protein|nr:MAG: hypothetical protein CVU12_01940 [Bacteroidetes bacterium HGW-Bacteroidetes-7]